MRKTTFVFRYATKLVFNLIDTVLYVRYDGRELIIEGERVYGSI